MKEQIRKIVEELDQEVTALAIRHANQKVRPKPHLPASTEGIQAYEKHLGNKLPPSYRAFLELYDGYDWLAYPGHMLSIGMMMPGGEWSGEILEWKTTAARYGSGDVLDGIVVASLGGPNNWVYFDPNKPGENGEFTFIRWVNGDFDEYDNLIDFLKMEIEFCKAY